jgi:HEAT repeat protein
MTSTQVNAALALLKKTLPDLSDPVRRTAAEVSPVGAHEDALQELE